jgi:hypothetical protein
MSCIEQSLNLSYPEAMPADLETRIQELCSRAVQAEDGSDELQTIFDDLRGALREHLEVVRVLSRTSLASIKQEARHKSSRAA